MECIVMFHQENISHVIPPEATLDEIQPHPANIGIFRQKDTGRGGQDPNLSHLLDSFTEAWQSQCS